MGQRLCETAPAIVICVSMNYLRATGSSSFASSQCARLAAPKAIFEMIPVLWGSLLIDASGNKNVMIENEKRFKALALEFRRVHPNR